jgi:YHS domain-containing protein
MALLAFFAVMSKAFAFDERIVFDPYTGLSLGGYDPVAYFTDGTAVRGNDENEVVVGDTFWHFANKGNADAFRSSPQTYVPGFGGYSPIGLARGVPQPGSPGIFTIYHSRVYLFASQEDRATFLADPAGAVTAAAQQWPEVVKLLAY